MADFVPIGSSVYFVMLGLLLFARGADLVSTRVATPNLILEGNPIAKKLGWKWGIVVNLILCIALAILPLPAMIISTTSVLVAAHNFQQAWLMRSLGEETYRVWHVARILETPVPLYFLCLLGQTALTAVVGAALVYFGGLHPVTMAIGYGIVFYAVAVLFYTTLSVWRLRRSLG